jgi:hypothetical protein
MLFATKKALTVLTYFIKEITNEKEFKDLLQGLRDSNFNRSSVLRCFIHEIIAGVVGGRTWLMPFAALLQ